MILRLQGGHRSQSVEFKPGNRETSDDTSSEDGNAAFPGTRTKLGDYFQTWSALIGSALTVLKWYKFSLLVSSAHHI